LDSIELPGQALPLLNERIIDIVSVVIPAYNAEKSIRRCIESVIAQTYEPIEIIVVNDGSTDRTEDILRTFEDRITYVSQDNQGETSARNRGFALSRGEFITFIDHDDHWHPGFVKSCVDFLRKHPETIAVSAGSEHRSALKDHAATMPSFLSQSPEKSADAFVIGNFFDFWAEHNHICAGSAMLRGILLDKAGGQRTDLALSGDLEFWAYLATFGKWGFIPKVLLFVDGTQVQSGRLYEKFYERYKRCASVESWQERILPRLKPEDMPGFQKVRGRIATWFTFAKVFVKEDAEAFTIAKTYKNYLEGKFGTLWRIGLFAGWLTWKPLCILLRFRTKIQYNLRSRRI
jgi:glycosyltransferase involved in cell wall biosynthesis